MQTFHSKWLLTAALSTALLAVGCSSNDNNTAAAAPTNPATSAQGVVDYILGLINGSTNDLSDPADISAVTLATDDSADASPL